MREWVHNGVSRIIYLLDQLTIAEVLTANTRLTTGTRDYATPRALNLSQVVASVFPHCQYTANLDLDTFLEIFRSAIIGNHDCGKGLFCKLPHCRDWPDHDVSCKI